MLPFATGKHAMGVLTPNAAHWAVGEVRVELGIAGSGQAGRADARGTAGKDWKVQSGSFFLANPLTPLRSSGEDIFPMVD